MYYPQDVLYRKEKRERADMSTRSNTVVRDLKTGEEVVLYRHFDGYLSGAGLEQLGYINLMEKDGTPKTVKAVKDWYIKNGEGYEETGSVHGDVSYIYELELDGEKSGFSLKAFTTKMFSKPGYAAAKDKDVTAELEEELESAMKSGELDKVPGFRPQDRARSESGCSSLDEEIYDAVADTVDQAWDGELREKFIANIVKMVRSMVHLPPDA